MFSNLFFPPPENRAVCEIMWENIVQPDRPRMTIWRMRIACWIPKATHTYCNTYCLSTTAKVARRVSMLPYTYIACLAISLFLLHVFLWILCQNSKDAQYKQCNANKKKPLHIDRSCILLYHAHSHFIHRRQVYTYSVSRGT